MSKKSIFRIRFINQGTVYEIYAKRIADAELFGFVEIEDLIFGETSSVVVDPSEERLKTEFSGVKCTYLPMHAILRIDMVEKEGIAKAVPTPTEGNNVSAFPASLYTINKLKKPEI